MADAPPPDLSNSDTTTSSKSETDRTWERAWTRKEMRTGASHWSLAGDAGLLLYLQEFSQKLISRTHEIEKEVENLVHDSKLTSVRVNNVFNEFMMLANTQFVENRVYEDESDQVETQPEEKKPENQEKTREQREAELVPKVSEAIKLGVDVIDKAFEKLETNIDNSDSEEDESYRVDPILEAKDPYLERSMPYLIGTPQFLNDDSVGLREVSDDEESDQGEISESEESESEEEEKEEDSHSESESDSDREVPSARPARPMFPAGSSDESDSDGDLFGSSEKKPKREDSSILESEEDSGEEDEKPQAPTAAPLDFASELARKLGGAPPKPPSPQGGADSDQEEKPKKKEHKKKKKAKADSKPAKDEDEDLFGKAGDSEDDDLFGGGAFGGKKSTGIFDDSDEGDLFGESSKPTVTGQSDHGDAGPVAAETKAARSRTRTSSGKKLPAGAVNMPSGAPSKPPTVSSGLFDEDEDNDDIFSSAISKPKQEPDGKAEWAEGRQAASVGGLFESPVTADGKAERAEGRQAVSAGGLFESDSEQEDDPFKNVTKPVAEVREAAPESKKPPGKKPPVGGVSMFGPSGAGNPLMKAIKNRVQKHESDEENDQSEEERSHAGSVKSNQSEPLKQPSKMPTVDSKDSLFAEEPDDSFVPTKPKSNSVSRNTKSAKGLFDDDDGDDLFGAAKPSAEKPKPEDVKTKSKKPDMFLSDEEDLFGAGAPAKNVPEKGKPAGAVAIFPGGADVFAKPQPEAVSPRREKVTTRPPSKSISLFDDDASAEGDLFGGTAVKQPPPNTSQPAASAKKSIFEGDGDLLGDDDGGDIFSKPAVKPAATQKSSAAAPAAAPAASATKQPETKASSSQFDSDSEDMFGSTKPKKTKPSRVEVAAVTSSESTTEGPLASSPTETERPSTTSRGRPPVGGVSMFGPGNLPPALGRGKSASGTEPFSKSEVVVRKPEPKKATVDPLFGGDDDENDLFATPVHKAESVVTPAPVRTDRASSKTLTKLPLDDGNDDDLFSKSPKKSEPVEPQSPVEARPRKPVGGVSMFGGINPFTAARTTEEQRSPPPDKSSTSPPVDIEVPKPAPAEVVKALPARGKIGQLQATLNFNPASMLPGAVAPVKEPEPLIIGFDVPAEARTLHSANKDRAKVVAKRRPPSRHARKAADLSPETTDPLTDVTSTPAAHQPHSLDNDLDLDFSRVPPPVTDSPERVPSPEAPSRHKTDLFGNDDLFVGDTPTKSTKSSRQITQPDTRAGSLSDDIFSSKTIDFPKSKTKTGDLDDLFKAEPRTSPRTVKKTEDDDFFAAAGKSVKHTTSSSVMDKPGSATLGQAAAADDDIFAVKKTKRKPDPSPIIDDDDDIFASSSLNKSKKQETKDKVENGFPGSDKNADKKGAVADDDIFSTGTKASTKQPADDDGDIFATGTKSDKKKSKKAVTKDEDLFADGTDIFSDIPKAKPKEKKTKKKTSTAPRKTIFKDDIDDIFADTSAATGKMKEKKKSVKSKPSTADTQPAVDDPLS